MPAKKRSGDQGGDMSGGFWAKMSAQIPRIRTPVQLLGLVALAGTYYLFHRISTPEQTGLVVGIAVCGVATLFVGLAFQFIKSFPEAHRVWVVLIGLLLVCSAALVSAVLGTLYVQADERTIDAYLRHDGKPLTKNFRLLFTIPGRDQAYATGEQGHVAIRGVPRRCQRIQVSELAECPGYKLKAPGNLALDGEELTIETIPDPVTEVSLFDRLRKADEDAHKAGSIGSAIEILKSALRHTEDQTEDTWDDETRNQCARTHYLLGVIYEQQFKFKKAIESYQQAARLFTTVYQHDKGWRPARAQEPYIPIAIKVAYSQLASAFAELAELRGAPDEAARNRLFSELSIVRKELSDVGDENAALTLATYLTVAFWANGNLDDAATLLDSALDKTGLPNNPAALGPQAALIGNGLALKAGLQAARRDFDGAIKTTKMVVDYAGVLKDGKSLIGVLYLMAARGEARVAEQQKALTTAIEWLEKGDRCPTCRYALACAYGRMSELALEEERKDMADKARDHLTRALQELPAAPVQLDTDAVERDPFLAQIVDLADVRALLDGFQWKPTSLKIPPEFRNPELWRLTVPFVDAKFSDHTRVLHVAAP